MIEGQWARGTGHGVEGMGEMGKMGDFGYAQSRFRRRSIYGDVGDKHNWLFTSYLLAFLLITPYLLPVTRYPLPSLPMSVLQSAQHAAELRDWSSVNELVQQILLSGDLLPAEILPLTLQVLEHGDFHQRWDAAKAIPKLGDIAIYPLLETLSDEEADVELRWFVGGILADFGHPEVISSLIDIINTSNEVELTEMAIATLGKIGTPAIEAISQLLPKPETRLIAVRTLAQIHLSQTVIPLLSVVKDSASEVRSIAIAALSSFRSPQITAVLKEALADVNFEVRKAAVTGLGLRQEPELAQYIEPLLNDLNLEVCIASAIALGRMKTDEAAIALFNRIQQGDAALELQLAIVRAIAWIETPAALAYLQQLLDFTALPLSEEIVNRLGSIAEPRLQAIACQILQSFLNSQGMLATNPQIQQSIATALGELGQNEATDSLIQLSKSDNEGVKLHAIAALKRLRHVDL